MNSGRVCFTGIKRKPDTHKSYLIKKNQIVICCKQEIKKVTRKVEKEGETKKINSKAEFSVSNEKICFMGTRTDRNMRRG